MRKASRCKAINLTNLMKRINEEFVNEHHEDIVNRKSFDIIQMLNMLKYIVKTLI